MPGIGIGIGIGIGRRIPPPPKVQFDILENGLDFITNAVRLINQKSDNKRMKYALLHLSSGTELILKEILRLHDWRFLFHDIKDAKSELIQTGDFESVRFWKAINRLESECKIRFSDDEKKTLTELKLKRNKIEHFRINETVSSITSLSSRVLNILIRIINEQIEKKNISPLSRKLIKELPRELSGFNSFVIERKKTIKKEFENQILEGKINLLCPSCLQQTFFINSALTCMFCNYTNEPEIIASELVMISPEIKISDREKCVKCNAVAVIKIADKNVCLNCICNNGDK
jgi:hypothetical protein